MDDDPDDLAAAFFAQQAAKEAQKTALPTKDFVRIIHDTAGEIDAEKWLATTLPHAQVESDDTNGIDGIILNRDSCCLEKKNDISQDEYNNEEMRDKIKQLMLQKIQKCNLLKLDMDEKEKRMKDSDTICTG